jgi:hypothetical protein
VTADLARHAALESAAARLGIRTLDLEAANRAVRWQGQNIGRAQADALRAPELRWGEEDQADDGSEWFGTEEDSREQLRAAIERALVLHREQLRDLAEYARLSCDGPPHAGHVESGGDW